MDELNLLFRNPACNQFIPDIVIDVKRTVPMRRGQVAEHELRQLLRIPFFVDTQDVFHAGVDFTARFVGQQRVHQPLIQPQLSSIRRNPEHVVLLRVNRARMNLRSTLGQRLHHLLLIDRRLDRHRLIVRVRHRQMKLIRRFNIRNLLEHRHQFRQVEELRKARPRAVSRPLRRKLNRRHRFAERRSPCVKMNQPHFFQRSILQIALHRIQLGHGIGHWRARRENNAASTRQFIHISAFQKHIGRFLRFAGRNSRHIAHFGRQKAVFERMRLIHKEPVHAQLLKGHDVILFLVGFQLFQPCFQRFARRFHALDGKTLAILPLHFLDARRDLVNLLAQQPLLTLLRNRNLFKLAVPDNHRVIIARRDARTELLAFGFFKVFFGRHQNVRAGIEPQKLARPLFRQVIGHNEHRLLAKPQPLAFHRRRHHLEGLARANLVCKQRIPAVQHMGNRRSLMFPQRNFRIHPVKHDMRSVVFARPGRVEQLVIARHQLMPAGRVFPYPVVKSILDRLLLLLGNRRFLLIQLPFFPSVFILHNIVYARIPQVERIFQNFERGRTSGAVFHIVIHVLRQKALAVYRPLRRLRRVIHVDSPLFVIGNSQQLDHKALNVRFVHPCRTEPHVDFGCVQILGLCRLECLNVDSKGRVAFRRRLRHAQLGTHVAGQIFIRRLPRLFQRVKEDNALQVRNDFILRFARQPCHKRQINLRPLSNGYRKRFARRIHLRNRFPPPDRSFAENIRLAFELPVFIQYFKRAKQVV